MYCATGIKETLKEIIDMFEIFTIFVIVVGYEKSIRVIAFLYDLTGPWQQREAGISHKELNSLASDQGWKNLWRKYNWKDDQNSIVGVQ